MVLQRKYLDPYVKVIETSSTEYLPMLLTVPGCRLSVHVALYLPTHGKGKEFVSELGSQMICRDSLVNNYSDLCIYLRGDGNVNLENKSRVTLLNSFKEQFSLLSTPIHQKPITILWDKVNFTAMLILSFIHLAKEEAMCILRKS